MTIEQAIQKALEGGYVIPTEKISLVYLSGKEIKIPTGNVPSVTDLLLDPLFWQSLGKVMGWGKSKEHLWFESRKSGKMCQSCGLDIGTKRECNRMVSDWKTQWHRFIDHLAQGHDINSFFEKL